MGAVSAQSSSTALKNDPAELSQLRSNWKKAAEQAIDSVNKKYLEALLALKAKFAKEGKLDQVIRVDNEIRILKENDFKQGQTPLYAVPVVKIISATYGRNDKSADVTEKVRELVEVKRKMFACAPRDLGSDPDPGWHKTLTIVYTVDGVLREQKRDEDENILISSFYN
jgi:hypothetical protein